MSHQPWDGDCAGLPQGPLPLMDVPGAIASEDLAFDADGNLVDSDDQFIVKTPFGGSPQPFATIGPFRAGLRYSAHGDLLVNDDTTGTLWRIDVRGGSTAVLSGLSYPNGMAADLDGWVYVTEQAADRIRRLDPQTWEFAILTEGEIERPLTWAERTMRNPAKEGNVEMGAAYP